MERLWSFVILRILSERPPIRHDCHDRQLLPGGPALDRDRVRHRSRSTHASPLQIHESWHEPLRVSAERSHLVLVGCALNVHQVMTLQEE